MDFHRRRIAGLEAAFEATTATLNIRAEGTHSEDGVATSTIAPYHSALNGVNQPMNLLFKDMLWWTLGIMALFVFSVRLLEIFWMHMRHVSAMSLSGEMQTYWRITQPTWLPWVKRNIMYAPLFRKRHNREIKLSSAVGIGILPTRIQALTLGVLLFSNFIYMFILNWENDNRYAFCAELRGRSGTLAVVNMVPLIILAGRNNPLIPWLKISYDTYNLIHRWLGRLVVVETVIHAIAWAVVQFADGGWAAVREKLLHNTFIASGAVGTVSLALIFVSAPSPIRHAFYETFLNVHIVLAFITFVCTLIHCKSAEIGTLPQLSWVIVIMILWGMERTWRFVTLVYLNYSRKNGYTEAVIEAMPGEATRVTMHLPRYVDIQPGSHAYLRFKDISPWESHPFSIAWVAHTPKKTLPITEKDSHAIGKEHMTTSVSFVIGAQTGFTRKLYNKARDGGSRALTLRAGVEGPYGGHHALESYGHVVLFAGSTGITHSISYLKPLIDGYNAGTAATRRITLVWVIRDYESLEWVRPWMDTILRLPNRKDILRIKLFITRPKRAQQVVSASLTVQMFPGRPNILSILRKEVQEQMGAMHVSVCGNLSDDVRHAVRTCIDEAVPVSPDSNAFARPSIFLHSEEFSW